MTHLDFQERLTGGDLIAVLRRLAPEAGANDTGWRGLTVYKFLEPAAPQWCAVESLSVCVVAQGRKIVTAHGEQHRYDAFNYLVLPRGMRFEAEILDASVDKPFLSLVLQLDPTQVSRVSADMRQRATTTLGQGRATFSSGSAPRVSPLDSDLVGALLRFLRSVESPQDRRVLTPIYLQEVMYRILQAEQWSRLLSAAAREQATDPLNPVLAHIRENLAQPLAVQDLAEVACMSPSAFSHLFREVTGVAPYTFIKNVRLDRAREHLSVPHANVGDVARAVGYSSLSHFINEFKRQFGVTPRAYSQGQRDIVPIRMSTETEASASGGLRLSG